MNTIYNLVSKHKKISIFVTAFVLILLFLILKNNQSLYGDAYHYISLSKSFNNESSFKFANFSTPFRGVLFPFLLFIVNSIVPKTILEWNPLFPWWLIISVCVSLLAVILPDFYKGISEDDISLKSYFIPTLLLVIFWHGLIIYPLSDLLALVLYIGGVFVFYKIFDRNRNRMIQYIMYSFISGILLYAAYNTRTIYLFAILFFIGSFFIVLLLFKRHLIKKFIISLVVLLFGVIVAGVPQLKVNQTHSGSNSIAIISDYSGYSSLFEFQLIVGAQLSEYETYISQGEEDPNYPTASLRFKDPVGSELFSSPEFKVKDLLSHPLEALSVYYRHFINMLNPVWGGGVYILDLNKFKMHLSILNYTLLFLGIKQLLIWLRGKNGKEVFLNCIQNYKSTIFALSMLVVCAAILPGAVEIRFFIPMYVLLYGLIAYSVNIKQVCRDIKSRPWSHGILYISIYIILLMNWVTTYALTGEGIPLSAL